MNSIDEQTNFGANGADLMDDWIRYNDGAMERKLLDARADLRRALAMTVANGDDGFPTDADCSAKAAAVRSAATRLLRLGLDRKEHDHLRQMLKLSAQYPDVGNSGCNRDILRLVMAAAGPCDQVELWAVTAGFNLTRELTDEMDRLNGKVVPKRVGEECACSKGDGA